MARNLWERRQRRGRLLAYLLVALLLLAGRTAYLLHDQTFLRFNGAEMERAAAGLARDGTIGGIFAEDSGPSAHVPPLYAAYLGGLYWLWGWETIAGRLAQEASSIAVTALSLLLLPALARRVKLPESAGWAAALSMAVLPINLWIEASGSWEQPYAALVLIVSIFVFTRLSDEGWGSRRTVLAAGLVVGVAALLSPALLPAFGVFAAGALASSRPRRRVAAGILTVGATVGLMVTPWAVRNYRAVGAFVPLRSNLGLELAVGNHDGADGRTYVRAADGQAVRPRHPFVDTRELDRLRESGEVRYMSQRGREAVTWLRMHPWQAIGLVFRRFRLFWFPPQDMWDASSSGKTLKAITFSAIGAGALFEIILLVATKHKYAWLLASCAIGPSLIYMVTHVDPRYRYPVFALTTMLAFAVVAGPLERASTRLGQRINVSSRRARSTGAH